MNPSRIPPITAFLFVLSACGDDQGPSDAGADATALDLSSPEDAEAGPDTLRPDLGADAGVQPLGAGPCEDALSPIPAGGSAGPQLAGELLVHVIDAYDLTPRAGATVRLDTPVRLSAETDESGCVQFSGAQLRGAASVSVFEDGRAFVRVLGQSRRELTVVTLDPTRNPPSPNPARASVSGVVTNLEVLTATSLSSSVAVARVADLRPITKVFTGGPPAGPMRSGHPTIPVARAYVGPESALAPAPIDFRNVSIAFVVSDVLGFWLDGGTQEIDETGARRDLRTHLGVYRSLRPGPDENPSGLEFELTHERDEQMSIQVGVVPTVLSTRIYLPFLSFPEDNGILEMDVSRPYTGPAEVTVPALEGALEGAVYGALFIATARSFPGPALRLVRRSASPDIDFGNTPAPPRVEIDGRQLEISLDQDGGSMALVTITRDGRPLWLLRILEPRRVGFIFDLTDVPAGLWDPLAGGETEVQVSLFRFEEGLSAHEVEWDISEMERRTTVFATDTKNATF